MRHRQTADGMEWNNMKWELLFTPLKKKKDLQREEMSEGTHLLHSLHLKPFGSRVDLLHQFLISLQPEKEC